MYDDTDYRKLLTNYESDSNLVIEECISDGGIDNYYYLGLRFLYGLGVQPDLGRARDFLSGHFDNGKRKFDLKGLDYIRFEEDFYAWNPENAIQQDAFDNIHSYKDVMKHLCLFEDSGSITILFEIFYQHEIGKMFKDSKRIDDDEVKKIIAEKHPLLILNPNFDSKKAFEKLDYLDAYTDWEVFGGLGLYLKAHCYENGIGTDKDIEEAIKTYAEYAWHICSDDYLKLGEKFDSGICSLEDVFFIYMDPYKRYQANSLYKVIELAAKYGISLPEVDKCEDLFRYLSSEHPRIIALKYKDLIANKSKFGKKYFRTNIFDSTHWINHYDLNDVPDTEISLARKINELELVSLGYVTDNPETESFFVDLDPVDGDPLYEEYPNNIYLNVDFFCPLLAGENDYPLETISEKLKMLAEISDPLDYLKIFSLASFPPNGLRSYFGHKGILRIETIENDEDDFDFVPPSFKLDTKTKKYYEEVGKPIGIDKDSTCTNCQLKKCPFKLAVYLRDAKNKTYKDWERRKYDFEIPIEELDFFSLSEQDIKNAKNLAKDGLVYFNETGDRIECHFNGIDCIFIEDFAQEWEQLNKYLSIERNSIRFEPINKDDIYAEKILKAAAIWSYLFAKKITLNALKSILYGGLNNAIKVLQNQNIDYYYGAVIGTSDDCKVCCSYIKGKLKDVSKKAYKFEEITLEDFCKKITGTEDFDENFSKIEGFSDELYADESHKKDESRGELIAVFGGYTEGSGLMNNSNILNASSPSENDTVRNNRGDTKPEKTIYMINGLHYRPDSKKTNDVNKFNKAVELLGNLMRSKYVILCGNSEEVESILELDERIRLYFNNNLIKLTNESDWEDEFEKFIASLPKELLDSEKFDEKELKWQFESLFKRNKLPLNSSELALFLRNFCITNNSLEISSFTSDIDIDKEWNEIIGMDNLKKQWKRIENLIRYNEIAKLDGKQEISGNRHMMFLGSPGVGKTKVARLMAKTLFSIGAISKENIVEVDRKDLVAEHVGQTAIKTAEVIKKAEGGVLFIDEAYSLCAGGDKDFGQEAISTLIKAMEDKKDSLIVIFAGYKDDMENKFIPMNAGLNSRIRFKFYFDDYSVDELVTMFINKVKKHGHTCDDEPGVKEKVKNKFDQAIQTVNFGFGRYVDKLFDETMENHAQRVFADKVSKKDFYVITVEDIPE